MDKGGIEGGDRKGKELNNPSFAEKERTRRRKRETGCGSQEHKMGEKRGNSLSSSSFH